MRGGGRRGAGGDAGTKRARRENGSEGGPDWWGIRARDSAQVGEAGRDGVEGRRTRGAEGGMGAKGGAGPREPRGSWFRGRNGGA